MPLQAPQPLRAGDGSAEPAATDSSHAEATSSGARTIRAPRPPVPRYMGFEITPEGREYALQVRSDEEPRTFVLRISHQAFAARQVSYQDAPDLCYRKLGRELLADPDLPEDQCIEVTTAELLEYEHDHRTATPGRKRRGSG
jgi:hypothetical protein